MKCPTIHIDVHQGNYRVKPLYPWYDNPRLAFWQRVEMNRLIVEGMKEKEQ